MNTQKNYKDTVYRMLPLRDLFYVSDLLQVFVRDKTLHSSRQIKLPTPHFVVFYNGMKDMPEKLELKLSDSFAVPSENPELELKVQILNINPGMNEELKEKCPVLKEYVIYVEKVRSYAKILPLEEAVEQAVEKLMDKCRLNRKDAEDKVNRYWE